MFNISAHHQIMTDCIIGTFDVNSVTRQIEVLMNSSKAWTTDYGLRPTIPMRSKYVWFEKYSYND